MRTLIQVAALAACGPSGPRALDPPTLPDGVTAEVHEVFYPVSGRTVDALGASMIANEPNWESEHAWGLARWRVSWRWRSTEHGSTCKLTAVRVLVHVHITLPEWQDPERAATEVRQRWNVFLDALRVHEYGHRDHAYLAGVQVHRALLALRTPDCVDIPVEAERRAREAVLRHHRLDEEYERSTQRGWSQGATWPPGSGP